MTDQATSRSMGSLINLLRSGRFRLAMKGMMELSMLIDPGGGDVDDRGGGGDGGGGVPEIV